MLKFFAPCPKGLEGLLFNELTSLNLKNVKETVAGVYFDGEFADGMRACLWSRFASRILLNLQSFYCNDDTDLYMGAAGVAWENYFSSNETIAVEFSGTNESIRNTQYGALKVKDAVCDRLLKSDGKRPDVDRHQPDVRIFTHLERKGQAFIGIDISGLALVKREYHRNTGIAPLKENLAAAMVVRSGYAGQNFLDPMCGSGTLLLEAAAIATDTAPGLRRSHFGFFKLKIFDKDKWQALLAEATLRSNRGLKAAKEKGTKIVGFDADSNIVDIASSNAYKAGFSEIIETKSCPLSALYNPFDNNLPVTVVTNPPYGERMGNFNELIALYGDLGQKLKENFKGSTAAVISSSNDLLSCIRLHPDKVYKLYNGALQCQLRVFTINLSNEEPEKEVAEINRSAEPAADFANRLTKNIKFIKKWAQNEETNAYRVYDADLPDYQAAIDCYGDNYVVQEYAAPSTVSAQIARRRVLDMISAVIRVTGVPGDHVILKSRERQKGSQQYEKSEVKTNNFFEVYEKDARFKVNLEDYLDTGLFLDARPIRALIRKEAKDKSFLNLFAYTASASVMAALGGAVRTVTVDMSRTYLDWGMDNFKLNNISLKGHDFIQADCLAWLSSDHNESFDLIYIDPPTFSNSKRMSKTFDVQRDHLMLLANLTRHLKDGGNVIFCTNRRNFKLDENIKDYGFTVKDITKFTIPRDFMRSKNSHSCFMLSFTKAECKGEVTPLVTVTNVPRWSKTLSDKENRFSYKKSRELKDEAAQDRRGSYQSGKFGNKERFSDFSSRDGKFNRERNGRKTPRFSKEKAQVRGRVWGPEGIKDL